MMDKIKFLKSRKAESGELATIPNQAFVEIFLAAGLLIFTSIYAAYILSDQSPYLMYYSKDMSLLQDVMLLTPGDSFYRYDNTEGKLNLVDHQFYGYYTVTVSNSNVRKTMNIDSIMKPYIHFSNPKAFLSPQLYIAKPDSIYFLKTDNDWTVSESYVGLDSKREVCRSARSLADFDPNEPFYISYNNLVFDKSIIDLFLDDLNKGLSSPKYFSSSTYSSLSSFRKNEVPVVKQSSAYGVFIGLTETSNDNLIIVYAPFCKKKDIGCGIHNAIISKPAADGVDVTYIPTAAFDDIDELSDFSDFVYIEFSKKNQYLVFDAVKEVIKG